MAKQKFEVTTFSKGIIGSASESDIPTDASAYSLNINPNSFCISSRVFSN